MIVVAAVLMTAILALKVAAYFILHGGSSP